MKFEILPDPHQQEGFWIEPVVGKNRALPPEKRAKALVTLARVRDVLEIEGGNLLPVESDASTDQRGIAVRRAWELRKAVLRKHVRKLINFKKEENGEQTDIATIDGLLDVIERTNDEEGLWLVYHLYDVITRKGRIDAVLEEKSASLSD